MPRPSPRTAAANGGRARFAPLHVRAGTAGRGVSGAGGGGRGARCRSRSRAGRSLSWFRCLGTEAPCGPTRVQPPRMSRTSRGGSCARSPERADATPVSRVRACRRGRGDATPTTLQAQARVRSAAICLQDAPRCGPSSGHGSPSDTRRGRSPSRARSAPARLRRWQLSRWLSLLCSSGLSARRSRAIRCDCIVPEGLPQGSPGVQLCAQQIHTHESTRTLVARRTWF